MPTTAEKKAALEHVYDLLSHVSSQIAKEDYLSTAAKLLKVMENEDLHEHFGAPRETSALDVPKSPVLGMLGDLRPGTDTLPLAE